MHIRRDPLPPLTTIAAYLTSIKLGAEAPYGSGSHFDRRLGLYKVGFAWSPPSVMPVSLADLPFRISLHGNWRYAWPASVTSIEFMTDLVTQSDYRTLSLASRTGHGGAEVTTRR
jgi:hypothetical protein